MATQSHETGLLLPSREVLLWADSDLAFLVGAARRAEEAGFDSVWAGDSLLARPRGEPLTILAAVAGATTRVTLGTAVLLPLLRHPVSQAHLLATLDRVAQGRLIVGIGPGAELPGTHAELAAVGVPSDRRVSGMLRSNAAGDYGAGKSRASTSSLDQCVKVALQSGWAAPVHECSASRVRRLTDGCH